MFLLVPLCVCARAHVWGYVVCLCLRVGVRPCLCVCAFALMHLQRSVHACVYVIARACRGVWGVCKRALCMVWMGVGGVRGYGGAQVGGLLRGAVSGRVRGCPGV